MSDPILTAAERVREDGPSAPRAGRDPVNLPMIRNWVEAIGDENPIYVDESAARAAGHDGIVAPPAMAQVWTMRGLGAIREADDPLGRMTDILDEAGFTSVVATNCDQIYHRYLKPGEEVTISSVLEDVVGPKKTGLGEGWFFTTRSFWRVGEELVSEMMFRILKFAPPVSESSSTDLPADLDASRMLRPTASLDTQFFWDGVAAHELRIQLRADGSVQHPPVPAIWKDKSEQTDYVVASGRGTVFSFVVHHAPRFLVGRCRSSWPWSNCPRVCGCSANCAVSIRRVCRSEWRWRRSTSTSPETTRPGELPGLCTPGSRFLCLRCLRFLR